MCDFNPAIRYTRSIRPAVLWKYIFPGWHGQPTTQGNSAFIQKYGDIFRLYIGKRVMITICGYENIHDAFMKHGAVMSNRPEGLFKPQTKYGNYGKTHF